MRLRHAHHRARSTHHLAGRNSVRVSWATAVRCRSGRIGDIGGEQAVCAERGTLRRGLHPSGTPGWDGSQYP